MTGERTKTRAICLAIKDYIRRKRKEKFLSLNSNIKFDLDWQEMEEIELKAMEKLQTLKNSCCISEETVEPHGHSPWHPTSRPSGATSPV